MTPQARGPRSRSQPIGSAWFIALALGIGAAAGLGAAGFRALIALLHDGALYGRAATHYPHNHFLPPSPWGALVILVPAAGAVVVTLLVRFVSREVKGSGVSEAIDAIYYEKGRIRPVVALAKAAASSISIGTGGSVGREGPILYLGAGLGSTLGQWIPMALWQRLTLIAAGAGAGIAASFNTPIGAVLFVLEIMMFEVSVRTLVPVILATAAGTFVGRLCFGNHPAFAIAHGAYFHAGRGAVFLAYIVFGILMGLVSAAYIRSLYAMEDFFEGRFNNPYLRHVIGMLGVGVIFYLVLLTTGRYYVAGLGYGMVQSLLNHRVPEVLWVLVILAGLKLLATVMTVGSGGSGGIFSPALFMGAALGTAYAMAVNAWAPGVHVAPPAFALAGMAGIIGGATGAALAAIVMVFEMTRDYSVMVPMAVTVALSYEVRRLLCRQSIYTLKLSRRRHFIPAALCMNFQQIHRARDVMQVDPPRVPADITLADFARRAAGRPQQTRWLVEREGRIVGSVGSGLALRAPTAAPGATITDHIRREPVTASPDETLYQIMGRMHDHRALLALVEDEPGEHRPKADRVRGIVTRRDIAGTAVDDVELFAD